MFAACIVPPRTFHLPQSPQELLLFLLLQTGFILHNNENVHIISSTIIAAAEYNRP